MDSIKVPCIRMKQASDKNIYSFVVEGKDLPKFASVSRIARVEGEVSGYQRPEIADHIQEIVRYLDSEGAILPNSIVVAFNQPLKFESLQQVEGCATLGTVELPIGDNARTGWIVDGQQRAAALRRTKKAQFPVSVIGFESASASEERAQFVLVNNTRPLPKSLVYELLPSINEAVPPRLRKRQRAYRVLEQLNLLAESPFHSRIRTMTAQALPDANISDTAVLKMIENSFENGALNRTGEGADTIHLLCNYWSAVREYYPEAWGQSPRNSRLTHGVGIVGMGFLMDAMTYRLASRWTIPPQNTFVKEMGFLGKDVAWTQGAWKFAKELSLPWNEIQNTSRHIEMVTNFLIRRYRSSIDCMQREKKSNSD